MQYLSPRANLFDRQRRRWRIKVLISLLFIFTTVTMSASLFAASADPVFGMGQQNGGGDAFQKLVAPPGLLGDPFGGDRPRRYDVVGAEFRVLLMREGREANIEIVCRPSAQRCSLQATGRHSLIASQAGRGDLVFKSQSGVAVLRITAIGGATLLGGAPFVPPSVPASGLALVPVE